MGEGREAAGSGEVAAREGPWLRPSTLLAAGGGLAGTGFDVAGPESVAQALGLLAFIVAVHEAGHFAAARLQGIHVKRFSVGFGPTLAKWQGAEVEYSLRAFPLGGYVAFPDDDPESSFEEDDPDLLRNRPLADRVLVISAGVLANFVFAYTILFTQVATIGSAGVPEYLPGVKVPQVVRGGVADAAGLRSGDVIASVNDAPVLAERGEVGRLVSDIRRSDGKVMTFGVVREGRALEVAMVPELNPDGYGRVGVQLVSNVKMERRRAEGPGAVAAVAGQEWAAMTRNVAGGLLKIFSNWEQSSKEVSGPVAIVAVGAEVARNDATGLFQFAALVNINLGVVNLLPFPGLDGGYLALAAVEAARGGKKLAKEVEGGIMGGGVLLLLGTGMFVILRDLVNLFQ